MAPATGSEPRRYLHLAQHFREQIIGGTLKSRDPLPSITSLQRQLGYARGTIARALHLLAEEGLIYQPPGLPYYVRGGSYQPLDSPGGHFSPGTKPDAPVIEYSWRGSFTNAELNALHAEAFTHPIGDEDWQARLSRHSLGWVTARTPDGHLAGFVNLTWDGGSHAFLLDTIVAVTTRHAGTGTALVSTAANAARDAGCDWLHADSEDHLRAFYLDSCGFTSTSAGLIALTPGP